jgi:hypothetical protein
VSSSITDGVTTTQPLLVDGYQSARQSRHVFNNVLGRGDPDVALMPASPRNGTLVFIYGTEAEALTCETLHSGIRVLTFADSDLPTAGMTYVVDGQISRRLDPNTLVLWSVSVDFREVVA